MRPTTAINDNVFDFQALLHPGTVFEHPKDVVSHPDLTLAEKRAILASWASDASAIASCPSLRAPEGLRAPVSIDAILEALCELDGGPRNPPGGKPNRRFSTSRALQLEEVPMDDIQLPRHVIDRVEHRWANRLKQDAKAWGGERGRSVRLRHVQSCGSRDIPVVVRRSRRGADALRFEQNCGFSKAMDDPSGAGHVCFGDCCRHAGSGRGLSCDASRHAAALGRNVIHH